MKINISKINNNDSKNTDLETYFDSLGDMKIMEPFIENNNIVINTINTITLLLHI